VLYWFNQMNVDESESVIHLKRQLLRGCISIHSPTYEIGFQTSQYQKNTHFPSWCWCQDTRETHSFRECWWYDKLIQVLPTTLHHCVRSDSTTTAIWSRQIWEGIAPQQQIHQARLMHHYCKLHATYRPHPQWLLGCIVVLGSTPKSEVSLQVSRALSRPPRQKRCQQTRSSVRLSSAINMLSMKSRRPWHDHKLATPTAKKLHTVLCKQ